MTIQARGLDLIKEIKENIEYLEGIPIDQQRIIFEGKQLEDKNSLASYNIRDNSTLHLALRLRGDKIASMFTFNTISNIVTLLFSKSAPAWRIARKGISWGAKCNNVGCEAYNREVLCNSGFGVFDVNWELAKIVCPICNEKVLNAENCGFYKAAWNFYGIDGAGNERKEWEGV